MHTQHLSSDAPPALVGPDTEADDRHRRLVSRLIRRHTFGVLATTSPAGYAHAAGVVYQMVDGDLWVHTMKSGRKARNIVDNPKVGMSIPFRRLPAGPPFTIQFQARAELVAMDDPIARTLVEAGSLAKISGHGALDEPDGVFVRITPNGMVHSYGPGAKVLDLVRDPLHSGARSVRLQPD